MDPQLAVALVAAAAALGSAVFAGLLAGRQSKKDREFMARTNRELEELRHNLETTGRREDRTLQAREVLDRYRRPLLASAVLLARRIENIRYRAFLVYLRADEHRRRVALLSILYRFAAYLGWRELLSRELSYLDFGDSSQTRTVLGLLDDARAKLSSSRFDVVDGQPRLMLWTDEQVAIGGLMLKTEGSPGVIGFETFFARYETDFEVWLAAFAEDMQQPGVEGSVRLREVAAVLDLIISKLDVEGVYGDDPDGPGGWQRADASQEGAAPPPRTH